MFREIWLNFGRESRRFGPDLLLGWWRIQLAAARNEATEES
jgi:hypothetical protein